MKLYIVGVLACVMLGAGCAGLIREVPVETTDPVTNETTTVIVKELTPKGEQTVAAAATVAKSLTGPLGLPAELIDWLVIGGLSIAGVKGASVVGKKIKDSGPGKMLG